MLISYKRGQGSIVLRVKIRDSSASTGAGLTGLTNASTGLIISTIADNESSPTTYTVAGSTIESITTLGTYAAPTATKCRFKEVDSTNHKGIYEIQIADARFAVSSAKSVLISISGATNAAECDALVPLTDLNPYDAVHAGLSALPNTACTTNASLLTSGTGTDQLSVTSGRIDIGKALGTAVTLDANNVLNVSTKYFGGTLQTARDIGASVLLSTGTGTGQLDFTSGVVKANATQWLGGTIPAVNVTGVPLVDAKYLLGTIFSTPATAGIMDVNLKNVNNVAYGSSTLNTLASHDPGATIGTSTLTQTQVTGGAYALNSSSFSFHSALDLTTTQKSSAATAIWTDTTASDFTTALSVGKSIMNGVSLGTGLTIVSVSGAVGSVTGAVGSVTGNVGGNVTGSIGSLASQAKTDAENAVWNAATSSHATAGTYGLLISTDLDAAISSRMATYTQPTGFLSAIFPTTVASTTNITAASGVTLTSAYDFAKGTVAITESYNADGVAPTPAQALMGILQALTEGAISGTTWTVKKLDGTTTAMTITLDSATAPTSKTRAT